MPGIITRAHYNYDNILAALHLRIPLREQFSVAEPAAAADFIGIGQCCGKAISIIGQKVGVALRDVPLSFVAEFDFAFQIGAS